MISFNAPLFISVEMNDESVYKKMLIKSDNSNGLLPSQTLKALRAYVCENKPFGISLYGNLQNTNSKDFLEYCYMNDIPLGYDLSCNKSTYDWIISNKNYFQLFRIVLFSLQSELNDRLFENNCIEDIMYFVKSDIFFDKGKVIVLPVTTENLNEVERIMVFALDNNYKINPLPLPYDSAIQLGLTPLSYEDYYKLAKKVDIFYKKYRNSIYLDMPAAAHIFRKQAVCPAFRMSLDIDVVGNIRPCKFSKIYYKNILHINSIWNEQREKIPIVCKKCDSNALCAGGCLANGDMTQKCDIYCKYKNTTDSNIEGGSETMLN